MDSARIAIVIFITYFVYLDFTHVLSIFYTPSYQKESLQKLVSYVHYNFIMAVRLNMKRNDKNVLDPWTKEDGIEHIWKI
jgi:hypothetical protein